MLSGYYFRETRFLRTPRLSLDGEAPWPCESAVVAPDVLAFTDIHPELTHVGGGGSGMSGDTVETNARGIPSRALDIRSRDEVGIAELRITHCGRRDEPVGPRGDHRARLEPRRRLRRHPGGPGPGPPTGGAREHRGYAERPNSGGMWMDAAGDLYLTEVEHASIGGIPARDRRYRRVLTRPDLFWPDGIMPGPDGAIYVVSSQLPHAPPLNAGTDHRDPPYLVMRFWPDARSQKWRPRSWMTSDARSEGPTRTLTCSGKRTADPRSCAI